ncbi:hypothetical protein EMPS_06128 [Entomortierella parvispora]|uniref:Uncharacterized protein n=1 Tax=Entomortierella parvispora TaxID=205924 RepID=A0A9P3HBP1_9FUNG|nr:hypothetical protein EMPS_06128 [Entomortierella parvispora]
MQPPGQEQAQHQHQLQQQVQEQQRQQGQQAPLEQQLQHQQQQYLNHQPMFVQQQQHQIQQQWQLEQQQNLQLREQQYLQEIQAATQHQAPIQDNGLGQSTRKRALAVESDEFMGMKKRNLGSEGSALGHFGYPDPMDSPGSIRSNMSGDHVAASSHGYFDQQPYQNGSTASSPVNGGGFMQPGSFGYPASAPATPAGGSSSAGHQVLTSTGASSHATNHTGNSNGWNSFGQGSRSSPQTPLTTTIPASIVNASNIFTSALAEQQPLEHRLLQEQQKLQQAQHEEQQRLQQAQQQELLQMQRHMEEESKVQAFAAQQQQQQQQYQRQPSPSRQNTIHHDHNDPATWGFESAASAGGQFTGYLGGYGKGYTPAITGGVAVLAAASAMAATRYPQGAGRSGSSPGAGSSGMDMDM